MDGLASTLQTFDLTLQDFQMILIGIPLFFIFWQLMNKVLFKPYLKLIEARESLTTGAESSASEVLHQADVLEEDYNTKVTEVRMDAIKEKLDAVGTAKNEANDILAAAAKQTQDHLKDSRKETEEKMNSLRQDTVSSVDDLAKEVSDKIKEGARSGSLDAR